MTGSKITKVWAREVLDSRGNPTVEAEIWTSGLKVTAIAPSGASTGIHEAMEVRDGGRRYGGKGVTQAVENVRTKIAPKLIGMDVRKLALIDQAMIDLDESARNRVCGAEIESFSSAGQAFKNAGIQAAMSEDYSVFVHLFDARRVLIAQRDRYPGRGLFPTSQWRPGDALADTYYLRIPPDLAKPADLSIDVGLYRAAHGSRLRVLDADGKAVGDSISLGQISVRPASCAREIKPVQQRFADHIALQGYNLDHQTVRPGETIHLTLFWRADGIPEADYTVFTHLLGAGDAMLGQEDAPPWGGEAPTSTWTAGRTLCDTYALTVRDDAPAGDARLVVGLYNPATMERLSPLGPDGLPHGDSILLGTVQIGP